MADSSDSGALYIMKMLRGGIVSKADTALKLAEILIVDANGAEYLESEKPLAVTKQSDWWVVQGRDDDDDAAKSRRPVRIEINKRDARILEFQIPKMTVPPPVFAVDQKKPGTLD